jgi:NAD(P)-dependent dehydrogenase (short-subunit alcohol dehydrogenase family)
LSGWYQAAKYALEAATDALRMETAARNIQVVLIEPGGFRTGIFGEGVYDDSPNGVMLRSHDYADAYRRMRRIIRPQLMGDPARVGRLVADVLDAPSPRARYVIGADARLLIAIQHLPTGVRDCFYQRVFGLAGQASVTSTSSPCDAES